MPIASLFSHDSFERIDEPALPVLALREAMVNAVCHKDYSNQVIAINLAIFDDRLEIWNYGKLPSNLKIDDLRKAHISHPRNRLIANVLYSRKFFEKWGSGTNKMIDLCREQGLPEPIFEEYSGGIAVVFKFKNSLAVTQQILLPTKLTLSSRQEVILNILKKHGAANIKQIMTELVDPPSQRMVRKDLTYLKKLELIEFKGSARNILWNIKSQL